MNRELLTICANCFNKHDNHEPTFTLVNSYKGRNHIYLCENCIQEEKNISDRNKEIKTKALKRGVKHPVLEVSIFDRMTVGWATE